MTTALQRTVLVLGSRVAEPVQLYPVDVEGSMSLVVIAVGWLFVIDRTAGTTLAAVIERVNQTRSVTFKQTVTEGGPPSTETVVVLAEGVVRTES